MSFFVFACSSTRKVRKAPPFKIIETTLSKKIDVKNTKSVPIDSTNIFSKQDTEIISLVRYANLSGKHELRWEWSDPNGKLYYATQNYPIETSINKYVKEGTSWHKISIKGTKAQNYPGTWKVIIYLDDIIAATDFFTIDPVKSDIKFGKYHALVIGSNDYKSLPKLKTAINDAQMVGQILRHDYGFKINVLLDPSRAEILLAFDKLRKKLTIEDNLVIYYAGHGWLDQEGDEGYWLPVDSSKDNKINWISNASITTTLKAISAKHILVVADSCYSGKLTRSAGRLHVRLKDLGYFFQISQKKARTVMSSGGLEPVIDSGGRGNHSVFATAFTDALKENKGIMDGTMLFNKIRRLVVLNSDQTPEYSDIRKAGHEGGDFLFVRKK